MSDNTASNLGTGQGVFAQKVGDDLQFKSLQAGTNVTLTADANNITITASNDTTALNLGIGSGLFTSKSGDDLQFRSIIANADSGISVTQNSNDLTFQLVSANVDAGKLGGVAASDYLRKSDNLLSVASAATARTNLDVYSKSEIDANVVRNNQNVLPTTDSTWSLGSNSYKWLNIYADNFYGRASVAGSIGELSDIGNVDLTGKVQDDIIKYNAVSGNWETGKLSFLTLSDTPANYTGAANKYVKVNSAGNGVEFVSGLATETYVTDQINALVGGAPGALDTLNELAEALNDDADFHTSVTNSLAGKENTITAGTTAQYFRGDKTFQTLDTDAVAEGSTNKYVTAPNMSTISIDALSDVQTTGANAPSDGQALVWDNVGAYWKPGTVSGGGGGSGDITSVVAGTGLTGGASLGAATLNVDVGTGANKIVQLDGSGRLPAVDGSQLTGVSTTTTLAGLTDTTIGSATNGEVLFYNGSAWVDQALTTDNVAEGSTNEYYTNAKADARIVAAGSANWNTAYSWGDHSTQGYLTAVSSSDVTAHQANLSITESQISDLGTYLTGITGENLTDLSDVDTVSASDDGKVLYYDHSTTSFKWKTDATGGTSYTDSDVDTHLNTGSATSGQVLSWNGSDYAWVADQTGSGGISNVVDDTSPQLGGTLDANGNNIDMGTNTITDAKVGNWDTAYGWGDHSTQGYLTSFTETNDLSSAVTWVDVPDANITSSSVVQHQANLTITESQISDLQSYLTAVSSSDVTAHQANLTITESQISDLQSYLTSETSHADVVVDGDFTSQGIMLRGASAGSYSILTDNSANWNTAYGWGDHSTAGYLTSYTETDPVFSAHTTSNITNGSGFLKNNGSGTWTYDSNTYLTAVSSSDVTAHQANLTITQSQISDLSHYTDSDVDTHLNTSSATSSQVLSWNGSDYAWVAQSAGTYGDSNVAIYLGGNLDSHIIPSANVTYDLGSATYRFRDLYLAGNTIDLGGTQLQRSSAGKITWNGNDLQDYNNLSNRPDLSGIPQPGSNQFLRKSSVSVTTGSASGSGSLTYDNNGGFTFEPADLSSYLIDLTGSTLTSLSDVSAVAGAGDDGKVLYYDHATTSFKWKTDATGGSSYTDSDVDTHLNTSSATSGQVLSWNGSDYAWVANTGTGLSNVVEDTSPQLGGTLDANGNDIDMGTNTITDTNVGNWNTAYSWGDHSTQGYLTAVSSSDVTAHQANLSITESQISDLGTYLTAETDTLATVTGRGATTTTTAVIPFYYANQAAFPNATTYHGAIAHSHSDGAMYFAHGGSWNKLANDSQLANSSNWDTAYGWGDHSTAGYQTTASLNGDIDSHLNQSNPTSGYVLSWNGSDYAWVAQSGGSGIALTDLSVTSASAFGNGSLTYNNSTGVFTYTPPLLTGYLQDITGENLSDLADVNSTTPTDGQVLTWDNANSYWKPATPSGGGGGSAGTEYEEFKINYATNGNISSISDTSSGISSVSIDSAAGGDLTVNFTGYTTPPLTLVMYGYQHTSNKYIYNSPATGSMTLRDVPGGGSSGSPTAFGSFSNIQIRCSEAETGAGRGFGTTTHAWVRFVMGS